MREEVKEREVRLSREGGESRGEKGGGGGRWGDGNMAHDHK